MECIDLVKMKKWSPGGIAGIPNQLHDLSIYIYYYMCIINIIDPDVYVFNGLYQSILRS